MVDFKEKPKKFQRLKHKYRLVILNDDTFEETYDETLGSSKT